jgi:TPR repeat protein
LICFSSGGNGKPNLQSILPVSVAAKFSPLPSASNSEGRLDSARDGALIVGEREVGPNLTPQISSEVIQSSPQRVSSLKSASADGHLTDKNEPTNDTAALWVQVKNQNSDAEIKLARLFLEGVTVPQNCAQARVLLLAASRRGNARAADLLSDTNSQCR